MRLASVTTRLAYRTTVKKRIQIQSWFHEDMVLDSPHISQEQRRRRLMAADIHPTLG